MLEESYNPGLYISLLSWPNLLIRGQSKEWITNVPNPDVFMGFIIRDAPIIGSVIGNADYRLIFSYRLSDRYVYQISSRSDIICGQSQSIGN